MYGVLYTYKLVLYTLILIYLVPAHSRSLSLAYYVCVSQDEVKRGAQSTPYSSQAEHNNRRHRYGCDLASMLS
jgi:hypothetical protein